MSTQSLMDRGHFAAMCYEAMIRAGYDADTLLGYLGFSVDEICHRDFSYDHRLHLAFWGVLEQYTGNADIGYTLGQHLPSDRGNILSMMYYSNASFGAAVEGNIRFSRLVSDAIDWSVGTDTQGYYVQIRSADPAINQIRHLHECLFLGLLALYAEVTDNRFVPSQVNMVCPPPSSMGNRQQVYGCDVFFGCPENRLYFDPALLALPCALADERLLRVHEEYAETLLKKFEEQDFLQMAQRVITELLHLGDITQELVSGRLGLTAAEFKYRLEKLGTHFIRERDDCRQRLVSTLLMTSTEGITQISLRAGFSEPSTFYRAFKRWSKGETPAKFRARHQQAETVLNQKL